VESEPIELIEHSVFSFQPVMEDEYVKSKGQSNGAYKEGFFKEGVLSNNDAIFNPDSSSSSLHQRKVK